MIILMIIFLIIIMIFTYKLQVTGSMGFAGSWLFGFLFVVLSLSWSSSSWSSSSSSWSSLIHKLQVSNRFNGVRWQLALWIPLGGAGATPVDQQQRLIMIKIKTMMMIMMMMMIMLMIVIIMITMIMRRSSPCRSIAETDNDCNDDNADHYDFNNYYEDQPTP